jgi:hypothetical protein
MKKGTQKHDLLSLKNGKTVKNYDLNLKTASKTAQKSLFLIKNIKKGG